MWSAVLIREARLRAGLTQQELADRSGRKRSVIARWEQGAIEPSLETFLEIIGICGFELPPELVPRDESTNERLQKNAFLSPERRVQRALKASSSDRPFDPYAILAALERRHTAYVVIGAFARIVQGAEETTDGVDIAPSLRGGNLQRLTLALRDLGAARADGQAVALDEREHSRGARPPSSAPRRASSPSCPSPRGRGRATTTSDAQPRESRSARACASRSRRPPTSPVCSPPSDASKTCRSSSPSDASKHSSTRSVTDPRSVTDVDSAAREQPQIAAHYSPG